MTWRVSIPVWGERYTGILISAALPSIRAAAQRAKVPVQIVIHTDEPENFPASGPDLSILPLVHVVHSVPWNEQMTAAHKHVLNKLAAPGDYVSLLNAETVVSPEIFEACERRFNEGKRAIASLGMRANYGIPDTSSSAALLNWGWENRHELTKMATYPNVTRGNWEAIYFEHADGLITARPQFVAALAIKVSGNALDFGPTSDCLILQRLFHNDDVHIVADPDELSQIDLVPIERGGGDSCEEYRKNIDQTLRGYESDWLFGHEITIRKGRQQ